MSFYAQPLLVAALFSFLLGMILFVPWMIYSYRKYGFFSFWATVVVMTTVLMNFLVEHGLHILIGAEIFKKQPFF